MNARELFLLSPYQYPAGHSLSMSDEDMAAWMNAYTCLWHPAALWGAAGPPKADSPYDYEEAQAHHIYGVPDEPPMIMSDDWPERARDAGAIILDATPDRDESLTKLREAFAGRAPGPFPEFIRSFLNASAARNTDEATDRAAPEEKTEDGAAPSENPTTADIPSPGQVQATLLALPMEQLRPFFAVGLGYLLLNSLSEAMEHENLLEDEQFWLDIQRAIAELAGVPYPKETDIQQEWSAEQQDQPTLFPEEPAENEFAAEQPAYDDLDYNTAPADDGIEEFAETPTDDQYPERSEYDNYYSDYDAGYRSGSSNLVDPSTLPPWHAHLYSAAQRLMSAREVLYPVTIYFLDLVLLDKNDPEQSWPASMERNLPVNVLSSGSVLEKLNDQQPEKLQALKEKVQKEDAEVCGGCYLEREDILLPMESQLWNLLKGQAVSEQLLSRPLEIFARQRFGAHPQLPLFLSTTGLNRALLLVFDDAAGPRFNSTVVSWPSPDGKQLDAFVRAPYPTASVETFFNLGHYLFKTTREDHSATLAFVHSEKPAAPWYEDLLELSRLGPIFGEWVTFSRYFNEAMAGEYTDSHAADEFHFDYLSERVDEKEAAAAPTSVPVSGFARHLRLRRRLDMCWSLAAMQRGLAGRKDPLRLERRLSEIEDQLERDGPNFPSGFEHLRQALGEAEQRILCALSDRLLSRAASDEPGYLIVNPCSFARRVALELDKAERALPIRDAVKACQLDDDRLRTVVEVPALGFAWIPRQGPVGTPPPTMRMRLADDKHVRNEFFEAEIDPQTGGMKSIADRRNPINRLSERLVFNPGSVMQASSVKATSTGPALGEVITEGALLGDKQQVLAKFRQRFRAWLGRPVLEVRIELYPEQPAAGYPWHAYYGARFAWGDERMMLLRGVNGIAYITTHTRPQTPDFLELRGHRQNTIIFPGGLPFIQRKQNRMIDVILMPHGETTHVFDLAIALDREYPMQTALGLTTPVPMIATEKGPPHIGATGWLFHLDTPHLLMTSIRPGGLEEQGQGYQPGEDESANDLFDAITVRLMECASQSGQAEFRCVRNPQEAAVLDARGERLLESSISGDTVFLEVTPNDFNQLQITFS